MSAKSPDADDSEVTVEHPEMPRAAHEVVAVSSYPETSGEGPRTQFEVPGGNPDEWIQADTAAIKPVRP